MWPELLPKTTMKKRISIQHMAAKVFADTGFDRASMTQLAKACGISKAAIYHYYDSKDDLLFDILETYLKSLRDRVGAVTPDGKTPEEYLRAIILEILLAYRGADDYHRVQANAMGALDSERRPDPDGLPARAGATGHGRPARRGIPRSRHRPKSACAPSPCPCSAR